MQYSRSPLTRSQSFCASRERVIDVGVSDDAATKQVVQQSLVVKEASVRQRTSSGNTATHLYGISKILAVSRFCAIRYRLSTTPFLR